MSDLFLPGDERAGSLFSGAALLEAMVRVEDRWLAGLVAAGVAPAEAARPLVDVVGGEDVDAVAGAAESGGNPVIPLVRLLRDRLSESAPEAARWLHRGLTSQDVLDTAMQLCARDLTNRLAGELEAQTDALVALMGRHRRSVMAGRTLTQHAVPTTFGLKAAQWLTGLLDARDDLDRVAAALPAQLGGGVGSLSAIVELLGLAGLECPEQAAVELTGTVASDLGLARGTPWHTARAPVTRLGDALVACAQAWGRIANDVLVLVRPEIAELAEPGASGRGGSSTMPQKANPVLSVLIRRTALTAPAAVATLHLAAAEAVDERPDGSWHAEWPALRDLARSTAVAAGLATELLGGLRVDAERMRRTAMQASGALLAERDGVRGESASGETSPEDYLGAAEQVIDAVIARARRPREGR